VSGSLTPEALPGGGVPGAAPASPPGGVAVGFYGKLPARGDFVRAGLPRDFTDRWDDWLQSVIAGSRALMGEAWLPAFLEAPVWRFALPPGMCGQRAALGLMLPSVDKAGRYFPLTFAALPAAGAVLPAVGIASAASGPARVWLDRCEATGRTALERDTSPQEIADALGWPDLPDGVAECFDGVWWSDGSLRVKPAQMFLASLPDVATYAAMLGMDAASGETEQLASGETTWDPLP
jgi:type VI secretion system protein ImpM